MGQMANGIFYGCVAPEIKDIEGDGEAVYDLICRWEKFARIRTHRGRSQRIQSEHEGGKMLLGVWVAVGGSGEDGVPYFLDCCMRLEEVAFHYATSVANAMNLWRRFADWAKSRENIDFPEATLWLTPCEVA